MTYIIDTDAIAHIQDMVDSEPTYERLIQQVHAGNLMTVEQVFDELKRWPDVRNRFWPLRDQMKANQYHADVQQIVGYISDNFEFLFDLTGSKNPDPADPWLIGCAKVFGYTLVTDERQTSTKKIPFVCRQQSIQVDCIGGHELIRRLADGRG